MQVGDLVKLNDAPYQRGQNRPDSDYARIGIWTEIIPATENGPTPRPLSTGWVQWVGNSDWDCEYTEDLEVISANVA